MAEFQAIAIKAAEKTAAYVLKQGICGSNLGFETKSFLCDVIDAAGIAKDIYDIGRFLFGRRN